jgi:hypothetical protein
MIIPNHIRTLNQCGDQDEIVAATENSSFYCLFRAARVSENTRVCQSELFEYCTLPVKIAPFPDKTSGVLKISEVLF